MRVSQQVAGVAVTKSFWLILSILFALASHNVGAAVLPADRADVLYHSYDGGGVEVTGPSVLVRKSIGDSFSGSLNYYIDNVSSASIDVLSSGASPYEEERTEKSVNLDYLHDKTIMSLSYTNSEESDYIADTFSFNISQDMFGDLTTVTLGYSQGDNTIGKNYQGQPDPNFTEQNSTTRSYRVGVSQVITKDSLLTGVFESIADEGYLQNPYRSARYCRQMSNCRPIVLAMLLNRRTTPTHAAAMQLPYGDVIIYPIVLPFLADIVITMIHGEYGVIQLSWDMSIHLKLPG